MQEKDREVNARDYLSLEKRYSTAAATIQHRGGNDTAPGWQRYITGVAMLKHWGGNDTAPEWQ